MGLSNEELLRKATLESGSDLSATLADFNDHGALSVEQVKRFLQLLAADRVMLSDVNTVSSMGAKWQETVLQSGGRILRVGLEATVGATAKPALSVIEMSTGFFKGIYGVSDEFFEDSAATDADAAIAAVLADQVGLDVEDIALNSSDTDTDAPMHDTDPVFALLPDGGWLFQVDNGNSTGNGPGFYNATADGQDYQTIFRQLLTSIPSRFKRNLGADWRYYVPVILEEKYRDALSARGTNLGDVTLQGRDGLKYQSIAIVPVPAMHVDTTATPDGSHILLTSRNNLYVGYQRAIKIETWRDPREGFKSWVVTTRFDAKVATPDASAAAEHVDVDA